MCVRDSRHHLLIFQREMASRCSRVTPYFCILQPGEHATHTGQGDSDRICRLVDGSWWRRNRWRANRDFTHFLASNDENSIVVCRSDRQQTILDSRCSGSGSIFDGLSRCWKQAQTIYQRACNRRLSWSIPPPMFGKVYRDQQILSPKPASSRAFKDAYASISIKYLRPVCQTGSFRRR